jgi:GH15 family glucan-1,4-alpha-glucosidase
VRIGNAAAEQVQNDTYGSVILAAMPMFYDRRLPRLGDEGLFRLLESLGAKAGELALEADNGIWEYRGRQRIHTHSIAMCWAGCHRLAAIASRLGLPDRAAHWNAVAEPVHQALLQGDLPAGRRSLSWDGIDARGVRAGSGVYWIRAATRDARAIQRVVRLD